MYVQCYEWAMPIDYFVGTTSPNCQQGDIYLKNGFKLKLKMSKTRLILAFSGKRKSGKDYCSGRLKSLLTKRYTVELLGISYGLKAEYAKIHNLDLDELLTDGSYKEGYRKEMIEWGELQRQQDSSVFCRSALMRASNSEVLIISDCRRKSDLEFFRNCLPTVTVRVECAIEQRQKRGFEFKAGIDDVTSECDLDDFPFDFYICNDAFDPSDSRLDEQLELVVEHIDGLLKNH